MITNPDKIVSGSEGPAVIVQPLFHLIINDLILSWHDLSYHGSRHQTVRTRGSRDYLHRFEAARHMLRKVLLRPMTSVPCGT
ncbi:unnamed protein product [Mycena citricolor]|uniref:Uncharacterized protein n=1 Tax=Mycena citricolor TaxID=2018698 RepID=A0AAD2GWB1_9AGAR|nr:unnamed protein product [Mycena citricolor]